MSEDRRRDASGNGDGSGARRPSSGGRAGYSSRSESGGYGRSDRRTSDGQGRGGSGFRGSDDRGRGDGRDFGRSGRPSRDGDGRSFRDNSRGDGGRGGSRFGGGDRARSGSRPPQDQRRAERINEPELRDDLDARSLDQAVRRDLLSLDKNNADIVARHLLMVAELLDEDPAAALEHGRAARRRAGRVAVVRETAGIAAYYAGEWAEALSELRAAKRISGGTELLPMIADCERGLGRPEKAVSLAREVDPSELSPEVAEELRIVESGARIDLGESAKAVVTLQEGNLDPARTGTEAARYFYAYAEALLADGRRNDAVKWFMNAAASDVDDLTDAEERVSELAED